MNPFYLPILLNNLNKIIKINLIISKISLKILTKYKTQSNIHNSPNKINYNNNINKILINNNNYIKTNKI